MKVLFILFLMVPNAVLAQSYIVKLDKNVTSGQMSTFSNNGLLVKEELFEALGLYLLEQQFSVFSTAGVQDSLRELDFVEGVMLDEELTLRSVPDVTVLPNDLYWDRMWDMRAVVTDVGMESFGSNAAEVWKTTTGGRDKNGNDIVVAIVDDGFDVSHEDLKENLWVNTTEIAGNEIDDDGNGYVDDINGWNSFSKSGNIDSSMHGSMVAGVVGAKGGNEIGVVGVNWDVKMMLVQGASRAASVVIRSYNYIEKQKRLWIETKGEQGANVVVTNSSFGIDYADCSSKNYVLWNEVYNALGKVGVLSAVATANRSYDVDENGDVPSSCTSDYTIAVTNVDKSGLKNSDAAYGLKSIDIGAPGSGGLMLARPGNGYRNLSNGGTSMATPHVAGGVALLYSAAPKSFLEFSIDKPAEAALKLKNIILETARPLGDLKETTVSGGLVDLGAAAEKLVKFKTEE